MLDTLTKNLLVRRDARRLRRTWHRRWWVWGLATLGTVQLVFCWKIEIFLGRSVKQDHDKILYYYFTGFHIYLQILLPLFAIVLTRSFASQDRLEKYLVTPIPPVHILWHLWLRVFLLGLVVILILYFPLWIPSPWLYAGWPLDEPEFHWAEVVADILIISLFLLPWIRSRNVSRVIWTLSFAGLFVFPYVLIHFEKSLKEVFADMPLDGELFEPYGFTASYARWHPLITLSYFVTSSAWSAGVGVALALRLRKGLGPAFLVAMLLVPLAEWGVYHLVLLDDSEDLYDDSMFLYFMLSFYMLTFGAFWMALKWRLLMSLSRWAVRTE